MPLADTALTHYISILIVEVLLYFNGLTFYSTSRTGITECLTESLVLLIVLNIGSLVHRHEMTSVYVIQILVNTPILPPTTIISN